MNYKKIFVIVISIIVVLIIVFQVRSYFVELKNRPAVSLISPICGKITNKITAEGNIEAQEWKRIDAPISGKIQFPESLKIGTKITKGNILLIIRPDEETVKSLREDLRESEEGLRLSKKKLNLLKQSYESEQQSKIDEINLERAKRKYELSKRLYELGVISYQDMETEEMNLLREEGSLKKRQEDAQAELELEQLNIIKKENQIKKLEEQLSSKELISPCDGVITRINVKEGEIVSRGYELITLVDPKELKAVLKVSGENMANVKKGQRVAIRKEYYSQDIIPGEVEEISLISEEKKDYFKVTVSLLSHLSEDTLINKVVYGEITLEEKDKVLTLPFEAIRYEEDGTPYLFIYKGGTAKMQKIKIGLKSEESVEIIEGIRREDKIIIQEDRELTDNQKVKLQKDR